MKFFRTQLFAVVFSVAALVTTACSDSVTGPKELHVAQSRWVNRGPSSYSMTIERSCECLLAAIGPVNVVVRNDTIVSQRYQRDGTDVAPAFVHLFPAVEGLFTLVEQALRSGASPFNVEYDPTLGYPTLVSNPGQGTDGPVTRISNFRAL